MLENYTLMHKNIKLGELTYDSNSDIFNFQKYENISDEQLPLEFTVGFKNNNCIDKCIRMFIDDRVIPEDRQLIDNILSDLEIPFYDQWLLCKASKGMSNDDYFWLAKDDNDVYEKIHKRYLYENGEFDEIVYWFPKDRR